MKIRAGAFYTLMTIVWLSGIIAVIVGLSISGYAGRCWFMGGIAVLLFSVTLFSLGYHKRERVCTDKTKNERKEIALTKILISENKGILKAYCADGTIVDLNLRHVRTEDNDNENLVLIVDEYLYYCHYQSLLVIWPTELETEKFYRLQVPFEMRIIIENLKKEVI